MPQRSLPVIDASCTEFSFHRTVCSCPECVRNSRHIPGYLIPADLDRLRQRLAPGEDLVAWVRQHLLALPGAKFGEDTNGRNKAWLVKRIAWRMQARAEGGLSDRARRRAVELADDADLRMNLPPMKAAPPVEDDAPVRVLKFQTDDRLLPPGTVFSLLDFAQMMQVFEKNKVSFVAVTRQFNTATSMGRLVLNVLLSFAQFEREIISERTRDKIAATRRKGKWAGG